MAHQATFTRGGLGKYKRFATHVGMCVPYQCNETDMLSMNKHFEDMAAGANWTNVDVSYRFSSRDDTALSNQPSTGAVKFMLVFMIIMLLLSVTGTILELTRFGDIKGIDYKKLDPVAKFVSIK